jgi:hypothetical protein
MVFQAFENAKRAFNFEFANFAVSFFYVFLFAAFFFQPEHLLGFNPGLTLLTNLIFFNLIHVLFQYWLLETSHQYKEMVSRNIEVVSLPAKMILGSSVLVFVLYALKSNAAMAVWLKIFVVGWASQHSFGQTYGLYCAKRLNGAPAKSDFKDISSLKVFVGFAVFTQLFLAIEGSFNFISSSVEKYIYTGFMILIFIWVGSVAVFVMKQPGKPDKIGWMFLRFLLVGFACLNPLALAAVFAVHGAEYFDVARKVRARSELRSGSFKFWVLFSSVVLSLVVLEFYVYFFKPPAGSPVALAISSFGLSLTLVHYLYDSFAYKMKHAESRKNLIRLLH